jgi:hypothetical protein
MLLDRLSFSALVFDWMPAIFTVMLASFPAGLVITGCGTTRSR